jgi:hypothetical protein
MPRRFGRGRVRAWSSQPSRCRATRKPATWGTSDGAIWSWRFKDAAPRLLGRHARSVAAVDMSRDAHTAASATEDEVKLWDVAQGSALASVAGAGFVPDRNARCFRMGEDGSVLWAGPAFVKRHEDGSTMSYGGPALKRWHPGDPAISLVEHPEGSALVALSADRRRALVMRGRDRAEDLTLYELGDTQRCFALPMPGPSFALSTAVMSAAGLRAASADYEHDLFVWDLERAVTPLPQPQLVPWHDMMFAGFSTDGCSAVFERADGAVTIIDVESGAAVAKAAVPEIWRDPPDSASTARESDGQWGHTSQPPRPQGQRQDQRQRLSRGRFRPVARAHDHWVVGRHARVCRRARSHPRTKWALGGDGVA